MARVGQFALEHLALDLEAHQEEEHGHQPVVDPQQQRLGDLQGSDTHLDRRIEEGVVQESERRVGERQRRNGGNREQNALGGFESNELAQRVDHSHVPFDIRRSPSRQTADLSPLR